MKLYPLLFLNEIAKSAGVALDKRLAVLDASDHQNFRRIILFIPFSLEEAVKKALQNAISKRNVAATDLPPHLLTQQFNQLIFLPHLLILLWL